MASTGPPPAPSATEDENQESTLFTYLLPFLAALFLSLGIAGSVLGAWSIVQPATDGCNNPIIGVSTPTETEEKLDDVGPVVERVPFESLTADEQAAFEAAVADPQQQGTVRGDFDTGEAIDRGVVVEYEGELWFTTLVSSSTCLEVDPLVLPLGLVALLVGMGAFTLVGVENYPWEFRWSPAESRRRGDDRHEEARTRDEKRDRPRDREQ